MAQTQTAPVTSSRAQTVWQKIGGSVHPALSDEVGSILAQLLANRGINDASSARAFLDPRYEDLRLFGNDASAKLLGLDVAVAVLAEALTNKKRILVFGDYDVDGVCGTAALVDALQLLGGVVTSCLPHRERDGYGLQLGSIPAVIKRNPDLVVTVDNGIQSHDAVAKLRAMGKTVIILDHHEPGPELPNASVVVNPKQPKETAPFKTLCAGGIVYRVIEQLFAAYKVPPGQEKWFLDLAALATVCDMVPLKEDNRLLVHFGLKTLQKTRRRGLRELIDSATSDEPLTSETIGFRLGPRLNAAGRLEHAQSALDLMLTASAAEAATMTEVLNKLNRERQQHTRRVVEQAQLAAEADLSQPALVLSHPDWPAGVCGLAAGRLTEKFNRPIFVLNEADDCVGSGRSVPGVDLAAAIESMRPLFVKAGGHAAAAGCTLKRENLAAFRQALVAYTAQARGTSVPPRVRPFDLDIRLEDVSLEFLDMQRRLEPFGMENPKPSVRLQGCRVDKLRRVGSDQKHVSLVLRQGNATRRAIAFGQADRLGSLPIGSQVDVLAQVTQNDWGGRSSAELQILDTMVA